MAVATTTMAYSTEAVPFSITTTFTAPTQCAQSVGGLTMLEDDEFRIWLNAPIPVPGTTITSCYPSEFISSFLLQTSGMSQAAFSPLVCPAGYTTQGPFTSNYVACCPSGWDGFAPASNPPSDRPAFGGTCYTNIYNVPIFITSFDNTAIKASSIFTATDTAAQAFAYPYEGFALGAAVVAGTTPARSQPTSPFTASGSMVSPSTAGTIAGVVICVLVVAGLLVAAVFFAPRYRRKWMTAVKTQQYFSSQIQITDEYPTAMVYMEQMKPGMAEVYGGSGKWNDKGEVKRFDDESGGSETEPRRKTVLCELDAGTEIPITQAKKLPDLPTHEVQ